MTDRDVCIALNLISGIGYSKFQALLEKVNCPENIFSLSFNDLVAINGINKILAEKIIESKNGNKFDLEINLAEKAGVQIITLLDNEYPEQLKEIPDPPLCLYVKGKLDCEFNKSIGVVGTRRTTFYGKEMAEFLVHSLVLSGFTIISGLAYGIDAIAHKTTVENNGNTIAVLGGGLARLHPQDHLQLARNIINEGGAVISEFPMEFPPNRKTFPMRNRIISGLSYGILVVEAGIQSGSLITANFALEHGRTVFAVPGNANSPMSKGCNKLIRDGAKLTENIDDIFEEMEFLPGFSEQNKNSPFIEKDIQSVTFSDIETKIISIIKNEDKSIDQISIESQINMGTVLVTLQNLELKKIITQLPGKRYKFINR